MLCGSSERFFRGSKCFLGKMSTDDLSGEPCIIKNYCAEKERWAVQLFHPRFNGKQVLVREDKIRFDSFLAEWRDLPKPPPHLSVRASSECGNALCSEQHVDAGCILLDESPFMIARNDGNAYMARWNLYFFTSHFQGADGAVMSAFNALSDGNVIDDYIPQADREFRRILESQGRGKILNDPAMKQSLPSELRRIATVFAKWQTNGHSFWYHGCTESKSALYHLGSKILHSCDPNCKFKISPETGNLIVEAIRGIRKGEELTLDYMAGTDLSALSVDARRAKLAKRGFTCRCKRCICESGEAEVFGDDMQKEEPGPQATSELEIRVEACIRERPDIGAKTLLLELVQQFPDLRLHKLKRVVAQVKNQKNVKRTSPLSPAVETHCRGS